MELQRAVIEDPGREKVLHPGSSGEGVFRPMGCAS